MTDDQVRQACEAVINSLDDQITIWNYGDEATLNKTQSCNILMAFAKRMQAVGAKSVVEQLDTKLHWYHYENSVQAIRDWCEAEAARLETPCP